MRYFIQFLVPALIVFAAVYMATRRRRRAVVKGNSNETGIFMLIIVVGSLVAVGVTFAVGNYLE
ncbi:MAG: hypothetical protein E2O61_12115 [Gammaproteobacteria bacterium]|nr:hypothetical protein [Pseudomonadota bacterium]TDJ29837.1 MAG: hypothetical protein E2O59_03595 [Gammaproteobacteria bacterium]TDJ33605.1 MAG: hypothetical protein E2O61_12115 [Gammaproteobacteria bacterium]